MAGDEHQKKERESTLGLATKEALNRLRNDIKITIDEYQQSQIKRNYVWLKSVFHHKSQYTTVCWISTLVLVWNCIILFLIGIASNDERYYCLPFESLMLLFLLCVNIYMALRENKLRHNEIPKRVYKLLETLQDAEAKCSWLPENYPHLCSPYSPCITLQWTYRDGRLINLPWALLVSGDIIDIRPGQQAPGYCVPLDDEEAPVLQAREVYGPSADTTHEIFNIPTPRTPLQNKKYRLEETPYLNNLRIALDKALCRPITVHNNERHHLIIKNLEQYCLTAVLILVTVANMLHYFYISTWLGAGHWAEMFFVLPAAASIPLLPLVFPTTWIILDLLGIARIHAVLHAPNQAQQMEMDPFEETDLEEPKQAAADIRWKDMQPYFLKVMKGEGEILAHSANLLHVLGSVTALCCIDKKGILSWPNPTAEKIFFLRNASDGSCSSSSSSMGGANADSRMEEEAESEEVTSKTTCFQSDYRVSQTVAEVLDLTHDHSSPFRLQFDDQSWKKHLKSLKPLGLAILLNTCNMATQEHYTQFCSHITCEALHNEDVVPVTNRRCLCELAKQIGFMDQAQDIFRLEEQLSTFKHVQPEMVRRDIKFARSLSIAKLKFPFPHMVAVVVREQSHGGLQLMAQGTADIILDSCVDFWDGYDLCPLSPSDRKKVQDFYQRTSLTAYCTAFAYRPLTRGVNSHLSKVYLELPADSKHLYLPHRSPTPLAWDFRNVLDPRNKTFLGQFHSTDSLLGNNTCEDDVNDVEGCFELQCNQVFIGMVTMQYQAQIDMVRLIEQLERACIRFVHFSKENELRSRVFSEKMGLESGWNCHISLLSDRSRSDSGHSESWFNSAMGLGQHLSSPSSLPKCSTQHQQDGYAEEGASLLNPRSTFVNSRALSFSAPSAINLEMAQVKFEDEAHNWAEDRSALSQRNDHVTSQDSVLVHSVDLTPQQDGWHSLSCLTDSTEQSAPVNFDLRNRAKLPRGIDKIRPHLEQIDNVPLLVSLFTDCTPSVTREMLKIMQDYGEVVCVMGSSANAENMPIFMQADASLAVEPLYPQVCQKVPVYRQTSHLQGPSPVDLSRALNSIACSISFCREDPISIFHLIMECRHHMQCVRNCMQFWLCCAGAVSGIQALNMSLMLPPIFSPGQVLWLTCIVIPVLSLSLVGKPTDPQVMQKATGKNQNIVNTEVITFLLWCYGVKFLFSICLTLLCYGLVLSSFCTHIILVTNTTRAMVYPMSDGVWGGWQEFQYSWVVAQHIAVSMIVFHFVVLSVGFVHRDHSIWSRSPHNNKIWLLVVFSVLCLQLVYSSVTLALTAADTKVSLGLRHVPWLVVILILASPVLIFMISELVKREEIKVNVRYQKRARLEFDTKLGMNSPF